jgi:hypothetical protein
MIRLWSINRVLRWFGFRLAISLPSTPDGWSTIGFVWYGWSFVRHGEGVHAHKTFKGPTPRSIENTES